MDRWVSRLDTAKEGNWWSGRYFFENYLEWVSQRNGKYFNLRNTEDEMRIFNKLVKEGSEKNNTKVKRQYFQN